MKHWTAIDPGASGSMCILYEDNTTEFFDFKKGGIKLYSQNIENADTVMIGVEKVNARGGQSITSMFTFGQRYGELFGMLETLQLGFDLISPQKWQKECGIKPKSGKQGIYEVMKRLYPNAELNGVKGGILDGRSDALGIAHYLRKTY